MIDRRRLVAGAATLAFLPACARSSAERLKLTGTMEQGSLVLGHTEANAAVMLGDIALSVSPTGNFAFGFAYDQTAPARLLVRYLDGTSETRDLTPTARQYEIQKINGLPETYVSPPPDIEERIKHESETIMLARKRDSDLEDFAQPFDWPSVGIVSGVFGSQRILNGEPKAPHFGVDIANAVGTPVHAPAGGIVSLSDDYYLDGGFTLIDHGHGVSTCYLHQSRRLVSAGDKVERGQLIGLMGMTGRATGPHLHWGMNWFQVKLDPSRSTLTPAPPKA